VGVNWISLLLKDSTAQSISNYNSFDFFTPSLTTYFIQKNMQNIKYFLLWLALLIIFFNNNLNLAMFVQIF